MTRVISACLVLSVIATQSDSLRLHTSLSPLIHRQRFQYNLFSSSSSPPNVDPDFASLMAQIDAMVPADVVSANSNSPSISSASTLSGRTSMAIALGSFALGVLSFNTLHNSPASSIALLNAMEKDSMNIQNAICNGKPTVVDFYAYWCESCKSMAPSMRALEMKYKNSINFVTIDGGNPANSALVGQFRVDAIPHVAFLTPSAEVKTALVGAVPLKVLDENMKALQSNAALPFEGYDAFDEESHYPLAKQTKACTMTSTGVES